MCKGEIKLLVCDLDETLLNSSHQISNNTMMKLEKVQEIGIPIAIATGRPLSECLLYIDEIQAYPYIISMNGAMTINLSSGEIVHQDFISQKDVQSVLEVLEELSVFYEMYTPYGLMTILPVKSRIKSSGLHPFYIESFGNQILYLQNIQMYSHRVHKFFVATTDETIKPRIEEALVNKDVLVVSSLGAFVEIIPKTCDKTVGVAAVCKDMGISLAEVMAIGDSQNDMTLLKRAGIGIAMENAPSTVKKNADYITTSNDKDGVAKALLDLLKL